MYDPTNRQRTTSIQSKNWSKGAPSWDLSPHSVKSLLMHNLYPPKIVHKQDFYMETCAEGGDSAQPRANLSNLQSYTPTFMTAYGRPPSQ